MQRADREERERRKREREKIKTQQQHEEKEDGNRVIAAAAVKGMGDLLTPEVHYVGRGGEGRVGHGPLRKG